MGSFFGIATGHAGLILISNFKLQFKILLFVTGRSAVSQYGIRSALRCIHHHRPPHSPWNPHLKYARYSVTISPTPSSSTDSTPIIVYSLPQKPSARNYRCPPRPIRWHERGPHRHKYALEHDSTRWSLPLGFRLWDNTVSYSSTKFSSIKIGFSSHNLGFWAFGR